MIYITQLIYIKTGEEKTFDEFEAVAIPLISKYNGRLLLRVRPESGQFIESAMEAPYEIHLVEFNAESDFDNFKKDKEREAFMHLKEKAVKSALMIKGTA
jgi:uncharacterized protein (DUF1330 family)